MLFSVIIPVFNSSDKLRPCLDSLAAQTCADWEAVCVDDGSADMSPAILEEAAKSDSRIRVLQKENGGVASARNLALEHVRGEWIVFLDADDVLAPDTFSLLSRARAQFPASEVICFGTRPFSHDVRSLDWAPSGSARIDDVSERLPNVLLEFGMLTRAYRRDLLAGLSFPPYCVGEDLVFMISAMLRARSAARVSVALYGYRRHAENGRRAGGGRGVRFVRDYMSFSRDALVLLTTSDRPTGGDAIDHYLRCATRRVLRELLALSAQEAASLWNDWWDLAAELSALPRLSFRSRLRLRTVSALRSRVVSCLLYRVWRSRRT